MPVLFFPSDVSQRQRNKPFKNVNKHSKTTEMVTQPKGTKSGEATSAVR